MSNRDDSSSSRDLEISSLDMLIIMLQAHAESLAQLGHDAGAGRLLLLVRDLKAGMA